MFARWLSAKLTTTSSCEDLSDTHSTCKRRRFAFVAYVKASCGPGPHDNAGRLLRHGQRGHSAVPRADMAWWSVSPSTLPSSTRAHRRFRSARAAAIAIHASAHAIDDARSWPGSSSLRGRSARATSSRGETLFTVLGLLASTGLWSGEAPSARSFGRGPRQRTAPDRRRSFAGGSPRPGSPHNARPTPSLRIDAGSGRARRRAQPSSSPGVVSSRRARSGRRFARLAPTPDSSTIILECCDHTSQASLRDHADRPVVSREG